MSHSKHDWKDEGREHSACVFLWKCSKCGLVIWHQRTLQRALMNLPADKRECKGAKAK